MPARSSDRLRGKGKGTGTRKGARQAARTRAIAVVWGVFNEDLTGEMRDRAVRAIEAAGYRAEPIVPVSGTYDLPFAVDQALQERGVVAAVAIGVIITGETKHDELIAHAAAKSLLDVSIAHQKPVGLGVTGPGQTRAMAEARVDRAEAAVEAVLRLMGHTVAGARSH